MSDRVLACVAVQLEDGSEMYMTMEELRRNPPAGAFQVSGPKCRISAEPIKDTRVHALEDTIGRDRVERQVREVQHQERMRAMHSRGEDVYCPFCGVNGGRHVFFCPGSGVAFR